MHLKRFLLISAGLLSLVRATAQSPALSYNANNTFVAGTAIAPVAPTIVGGTLSTFSISPNLPAGLQISGQTGAITGTPTSQSATSTYTVTGTNAAAHTARATLSITVNNPPVPVISYPSPNVFNVAQPILSLRPIVTGTVQHYSVSPALPAGLALDATTGVISGTATGISAMANYTVKADNGPVSNTAVVGIEIRDLSLPKVEYPTPNDFTVYSAIGSLIPTFTGGSFNHFSISPALPAGLSIDVNTGMISGIPTIAIGPTNFAVTASNGTDTRQANVSIKVNPAIPANDYDPPVAQFLMDSVIKGMKPVNGDSHAVWSTNDQLPAGLRLNSQTGEISGTPTKSCLAKTYTITATNVNSGSSTQYHVNISVAPREDVVRNPTTIAFVGQGDIQQSLNTHQKFAANTGIGVIIQQGSSTRYKFLHDIEVELSINVASTIDTVKSVNDKQNLVTNKQDFGNSVLLPLNSGQAFAFSFKGYLSPRGGPGGNFYRNLPPKALGGFISGFQVNLNGSNRNWQYIDQDNTKPSTMVKTSLLSLYVGPFYEFFTPKSAYNRDISVILGAGFSGRWILGDIQQGNQTDFRSMLLGSNHKSFTGGEVVIALKFYQIKAEVHLPFLSDKHSVPGLTGTHLTTFIGFSGGFPIALSKPTTSQP